MRKLLVLVAALAMLLLGGMRVSAQQVLTLPSGGPYALGRQDAFAQLGQFSMLAVTFAPRGAVLYMDGKPLALYTVLTRQQAARVMVFSTGANAVALGVTAFYAGEAPQEPKFRILSVNPAF